MVDTCYSEKGREIDVFVVSRDPTLMFLSTRDDRPSLKCALRSLASLVGLPSVVLAAGEALSHLTGEE